MASSARDSASKTKTRSKAAENDLSNSTSLPASDGAAASASDLASTNGTDGEWSKVDSNQSTTAKKLYEGPRDREGYQTWLDEPPQEMAEIAARKTQRKAHPLVLRYLKSVDESGDKVFRLHSLVIQSETLKTAVRDILSDYPTADQHGIHTDEPTFEPPFQPFFHRWDRFEEYLASDRGSKDAELLHSIIDAELKPVRRDVRSMVKHNVINFDLLWTLYKPGSLVFGRLRGKEHVLIAHSTKRRQMPMGGPLVLDISMRCIDYDGVKFGESEETISVIEYMGERKIGSLDAFPVEYHPDQNGLMNRLRKRGEKYRGLVKGGYEAYNGMLYHANHFEPQFVESRVIIDCAGYIKYNPYSCEKLQPLSERLSFVPNGSNGTHATLPATITATSTNEGSSEDQTLIPLPSGTGPASSLIPEQYPFCRSLVRGFCLYLKKWVEMEVDEVEKIQWNEDAFAKLVMLPARKRLIRALVKEQSSTQKDFDDVIQGKGLGLIMLLSGPPGTGKTLTGESIADALRRPLYYVSASELGDSIQDIEKSLTKVFDLAARFHSIMLLDEADAFLEKRTDEMSPEATQRNKRVAAFLRLLEYYKGTLILTTNRHITFDEAFSSRIHLRLYFQPLDAAARKQIWTNLLSGITTDVDFDVLARIDMNGREIKNVVKMARLLAKHESEILGFGHIKDVMEVMEMPLGDLAEET